MALIKKFESLSIDTTIEHCKDVIETLSDFEDDVEIKNYAIGYIYSDRVEQNPTTERDKKGIKFNLFLKKEFKSITGKESFDDQIFLLQKSKYLYSKIRSYCDEIKIDVRTGYVTFILQFENTDESIKNKAKLNRVYKGLGEALKDYDRFKTIYLSSEEQLTKANNDYYKDCLNILRSINKGLEKKKEFTHFRFSVDMSEENGIITLKPKQFRYKDGYSWKTVRYNSELAKNVVRCLQHNLESGYIYNVSRGDIKYEEKDTELKIIIL
jgi:hypothetical protein